MSVFSSWLRPTAPTAADHTPAPAPNVRIGPHVTVPVNWCCDLHNAGSPRHAGWCRTADTSRFPLAGPRGPLFTDPNWAHLNRKDGAR